MSIEAMKAALEVLESIGLKTEKMVDAIALLREALAEPKREWVGLTKEDITLFFDDHFIEWGAYTVDFIEAIEARLKEKNCG